VHKIFAEVILPGMAVLVVLAGLAAYPIFSDNRENQIDRLEDYRSACANDMECHEDYNQQIERVRNGPKSVYERWRLRQTK